MKKLKQLKQDGTLSLLGKLLLFSLICPAALVLIVAMVFELSLPCQALGGKKV